MPALVDRIRAQFASEVEDGEVGVKSAIIKTPVVDRTQRLVKGLVTTTSVDMDDEVVEPNFDTTYFPERHKAVYLDHQYHIDGKVAAVGVCRAFAIRPNGAYASTWVRETALGDDVLSAIEDGALQGMSIGFRVLDSGPPNTEDRSKYGDDCVSVVRRSKLLEYSFTSMPANPDAMIRLESLASKGVIRRKSAVLMGLPDTATRKHHPTREPRSIVIKGGVGFVVKG